MSSEVSGSDSTSSRSPVGVTIIALFAVLVGAAMWYRTGYRVFFALQLVDLAGQAGAGSAKAVQALISNAFEVVFNASMCLSEEHYFGAPAGGQDDSGAQQPRKFRVGARIGW